LDVKHARAVNNGTAALICGLAALGIDRGDEVIVPSFTFIASVNTILYFGAKPVFVDVNRDTFNLDIDDVKKKITSKTKAIMPVHLYGLSVDMNPLNDLAAEKGIKIIEDACQAHGADYKGKKCGALGDVAGFSLYPTKNMYCGGEGGLISTDDDDLIEKIRLYSNHGQSAKYIHSTIGFNFRLPDANGVVARHSLRDLDKNNQKRIDNAKFYNDHLEKIEEIEIPIVPKGYKHVYHQYTLKVKRRDELADLLRSKQIGFGIHYGIPVHEQQSMKELGFSASLPITEKLSKEVISLAIHPLLNEEQLEFVTKSIAEFYKK